MKRFYRYYVLALLVLLYLLNFIDRNIIIALSPYIKSDLHVTDAQLGLLVGTTFALFYALMGLPLAKLGDVTLSHKCRCASCPPATPSARRQGGRFIQQARVLR